MHIKNVREMEYFTAVDGCRITETFGIPEGIKDGSVALAILPKGRQTDPHLHNFLEWYIVVSGEGMMYINDEHRKVADGDNILIRKGEWHSIKNTGKKDLKFYCFCIPAFNLEGTTMKDGSTPKEDIERDFTR